MRRGGGGVHIDNNIDGDGIGGKAAAAVAEAGIGQLGSLAIAMAVAGVRVHFEEAVLSFVVCGATNGGVCGGSIDTSVRGG